MNSIHRRLQEESGQMLVVLVGVLTIMFAVGAILVDVGLYVTERRGAQSDADFIALSGAWELIDPSAGEAEAVAGANDALEQNDEGNVDIEEIEVDLDSRCVSVTISHDSARLFSSLFDLDDDPEIGANATACAGAAQGPGNLLPFQIDDDPGPCFDVDEEPIFTAMCPIELGAQGGNSSRGMADLEAPGDYCSDAGSSGDIEEMIVNGAPGICLINTTDNCNPDNGGPWYNCIAVQTGNPKKVLDGVTARLALEGACDTDSDGTEDFDETVQLVFDSGDPTTSVYEARDCDPSTPEVDISVRLVSIIVLEEEPPNNAGNTGFPIIAFAGFYLAGCAHESVVVVDESDLARDCNPPGSKHIVPSSELFVMAPGAGAIGPQNAGANAPNMCHNGPYHGRPGGTCPPTPSPSPTPSPTPTPGPTASPSPSPSASPSPTPTPPEDCGSPGHCVVYGRFVNLIAPSGDIGDPDDQTTIFGIALVD